MNYKIKINPALLAALEHYAEGRYNFAQPSLFVHTDANGHRSPWSLERTCGLAFEVLADEELNLLKFKALKAGLKERGMETVYELIMGENSRHNAMYRAKPAL